MSVPSRQGRLVGGLQQHPVGRRRGGGGSYQASLPDPEAQGDRDGIQMESEPEGDIACRREFEFDFK